MRPALSVVVPLKDEQDTIDALHQRLRSTLDGMSLTSELVLVDDGSTDATPVLLADILRRDESVRVVRLSRNFGHQAAVTAGIDHARGRAIVIMDGDLQDPPELIPSLVDAWRCGFDVVYAVRRRRVAAWPMRVAYTAFYRIFRQVSDVDMPLDSGDFCLIDRRVARAMRALPETSRFVRGLRSYVGFRQTGVPYDRPARSAGASKYGLRALVLLACDGLISFSGRPLRLATYLGLTTAVVALALTMWVLADAMATHTAPRGWASTMVVVLFMGAVQLVCLGIVGEYLRQIFVETKRRPTYIVDRVLRRRRRASEPMRRSVSHESARP